MFNWPHMIDNYPLIGLKELKIVDNEEDTNPRSEPVDIPLMPEIWLKPDYEDYADDFSELISKEDYKELSWFNWEEMDTDFWPNLQAQANYKNEEQRKIDFSADASNGPRDFNYIWDFGDGTNCEQQNPTHTYEQNGFYDVKLTVTDNEGRIVEQIIENIEVSKSRTKTLDFLQRFPLLQNLLFFIL
jgi:hypothetical protein